MRVLVVIGEPFAPDAMRERCGRLLSEGHELAVCYTLAPLTNLPTSLGIQRRIAAALREGLESSAERIPIFVVTGAPGDGVEECARAWEATEVRT
jgi:hypothetical protein